MQLYKQRESTVLTEITKGHISTSKKVTEAIVLKHIENHWRTINLSAAGQLRQMRLNL